MNTDRSRRSNNRRYNDRRYYRSQSRSPPRRRDASFSSYNRFRPSRPYNYIQNQNRYNYRRPYAYYQSNNYDSNYNRNAFTFSMQEAFELAAQKKAEQKIEEMVKIVQQVENSFETHTTETTTSTTSKKRQHESHQHSTQQQTKIQKVEKCDSDSVSDSEQQTQNKNMELLIQQQTKLMEQQSLTLQHVEQRLTVLESTPSSSTTKSKPKSKSKFARPTSVIIESVDSESDSSEQTIVETVPIVRTKKQEKEYQKRLAAMINKLTSQYPDGRNERTRTLLNAACDVYKIMTGQSHAKKIADLAKAMTN